MSQIENTIKAVAAARKRMNAKAVGYTVSANAMPASQESAPYLGRASAADVCDEDELADAMVEDGCQVDKAGIKLVWNAAGGRLLEEMPKEPRRFDLGFASFEPKMKGTLPTMDADFDVESNSLYVGARPSDAIRDALAGGVPTRKGDSAALPEIFNVQTPGLTAPNTVKAGGERFDILGSGITCRVGDERAAMKLPDGTEVAVELEMQTPADGCQRIVGRLPQSVPGCTGAKLTLWTHGLRTEGAALPVAKGNITILADDTPPAPQVPVWESSDGLVKVMSVSDAETGDTFTWGDVWNMLGEGFTGTAPGWFVEIAMLSTAPGADPVNLDFDVKSATEIELTPGAGAELDAGEYPNATITFGIAHESEEGLDTETAEIPVRLVVSG